MNKWIIIRTLVLAVVIAVLLVATNTGGDRHETETEKAHRNSGSSTASIINSELPKNLCDLKFSYGKRKSFRGSAADRTVLISQQAVYRIVGELQKQFALPFEIEVVFRDCGGPDSYYDEGSHEIVICYELIDAYSQLFSPKVKERTTRDEAAKGAVVSMFLHEVAHALIDRWNFSINGPEEEEAA